MATSSASESSSRTKVIVQTTRIRSRTRLCSFSRAATATHAHFYQARRSLLWPEARLGIPDSPRYASSRRHLTIRVLRHSLPPPGGDVNLADNDGDTPLYTVEDTETAQFLLDHGALLSHTNHEGISVCTLHFHDHEPTLPCPRFRLSNI
jgi:hypothetical protein